MFFSGSDQDPQDQKYRTKDNVIIKKVKKLRKRPDTPDNGAQFLLPPPLHLYSALRLLLVQPSPSMLWYLRLVNLSVNQFNGRRFSKHSKLPTVNSKLLPIKADRNILRLSMLAQLFVFSEICMICCKDSW